MKRKLLIVTGTRAEWGLLSGVARLIRERPDCELQIVACAAHLSPHYGMTVDEIVAAGFTVDARIPMLDESDGDGGVATARAMGRGIAGFAQAFESLQPNIAIVLGDRFEILAAAAAALVNRVPLAHIHGGELSEGAVDDAIRHAVTKMAHLHFVAAGRYRKRVIQLGEDPAHVYDVGALGVENALGLARRDRSELERELGIRLGKRSLVVTFHPVTLSEDCGAGEIDELLAALNGLPPDVSLLFTLPNADLGNAAVRERIEGFVAGRSGSASFDSLGQVRYLSALSHSGGAVGNSSSGLIEAPSLGVGTINIGDRQAGRLRAPSVIDCAPDRVAISAGLERLFSPQFHRIAQARANPYGGGETARDIVRILAEHPLGGLIRKRFHDLSYASA